MPTKAEIAAELEYIQQHHLAPGKWVRFESAASAGRAPVVREGCVTRIDMSTDDPHKSPTVHYECTTPTGEKKEYSNHATKLVVLKRKPHQ